MILAGAWLLDLLLGDPAVSFHPVALMGRLALRWEAPFRRCFGIEFMAGMFCSLGVYLVFAASAWFMVRLGMTVNYWLGISLAMAAVYITIAPRSLCSHAKAVETRLLAGDLPGARRKVGMIVSRDPEALQEDGVVRSCVESLGENVADGVTVAIFYAALGWLFGGPAGAAAAAWFYRSSNTLDATFGYQNERYRHFGTFPARFDDVLNFIPARLTLVAVIISAALLRLYPGGALRCAWRDHGKHPSPNSAWGMAAFAGALGVQLGGPTKYATGWHEYPHWGDAVEKLHVRHIRQARRLVMTVTVVFMALMILAVLLFKGGRTW